MTPSPFASPRTNGMTPGLVTRAGSPGFGIPGFQVPRGSPCSSPFVLPSPSESIAANVLYLVGTSTSPGATNTIKVSRVGDLEG